MEPSTRSRSERLVGVALLCAAVAFAPLRTFAADAAELKAKQLFSEAQKLYDVGQFSQALELYTEAYKLKPLAGFLFNIAQCHRQMGNWEQTAFFFGRFIDNSNPRAPNIEVARELLEDARRKQTQAAEDAKAAEAREQQRVADEEARRKAEDDARRAAEATLAQQALPPPPPPPAEEPVTKKAWFWVVVGVGVAAVAGGVTAAVVVASNRKPGGPPVLSETTLGTIEVK